MKKILLLLGFIISYCFTFADARILVFHRFDDERYKSTSISNERLRYVFDYLKENSYKIVSLGELIEKIESGEDLEDDLVAITIDDGYRSFYDNGLEIFKEYGYTFTLFVNTEAIEGKYGDFVTWEEAKEISEFGEIGSHGHTHNRVWKMSEDELKGDIGKSVGLIEEKVGKKCKYYSYPYGEYDESSRKIVESLGFEGVFNQDRGGVGKDSNKLFLDRIAVGEDTNIGSILKIGYLEADWESVVIEGGMVKSLRVKMDESIESLEIYLSGYGWERVKVEDGVLELEWNKKIKLNRSRIILKSGDDRYSTRLVLNY